MKILITGSSGFIGRHLVEKFKAQKHTVIGIDNKPSPYTNIIGDIRDYPLMKKITHNIDAIIHCAAQTSIPKSVKNPTFDAENNIIGTLNLLEAARKTGKIKRFIYLSSAAVYGKPEQLPINENHPCKPISPYGISKLTGELYTKLYHELYDLPTVCIRLFNVYGHNTSNSEGSGVITVFAKRITKGLPPIIYGNGEQTRDFIHIDDVTEMIDLTLKLDKAIGETFNCGTGKETKIKDLAEIMITLSGLNLKPKYTKPRPGDIKHSYADITKAEKILGFKPKIPLEKGLEDLLKTTP